MSIRLPLTRFARASRWISTEASTTRSIPSIRSFVRPQQSYFLTPPSSRLFTTTSFRLSTMSSGQPETVTLPVLEASELPDGSMKQVEFKISDDKKGKVLLSKIKGVLYATSANCTHYGAPLAKGVLDTATGRVVCPWHGACFSVCSGDIEDAPGLDALWTYDAKLSDDGKMILVTADVNQITSKVGRSPLVRGKAKNANSTIKKAEKGTAAKDQTVVIIGGGSGGLHTIESLREHEYEGKIVLISKEPHPPIDRTKLSKALITDVNKLIWRSESELKEKYHVDLHLGTSVTSLDTSSQQVHTDKGNTIRYDHLVLVPGATPKKLPIPGADLENVFTMRGIKDAQEIVGRLDENTRVAIIGSSFIGLELAGAIAGREKKPKSIDVIGVDKVPFAAILGPEIGEALRKKLESQGVKFHMEATIEKLAPSESDSGKVGKVIIKDSDDVPCDILVMGTGVAPATGFLKGSTISLNDDGSVDVDEYMQVFDHKNIWAAGDIATYPSLPQGGPGDSIERRRVEHWNLAGDQGRVIGENIAIPNAFPKKAYTRAPYFWSSLGGGLRYVGTSSSKPDDIYIDGDLSVDGMSFVAYYGKEGKPFAVASIKKDPYVSQASELLRLNQMPTMEEVKKGKNIMEITIGGKAGN